MKLKLFVLLAALLAMMAGNLPAQTLTILHNFTNSPDGANPVAGLLLADGRLYGTTEKGGSTNDGCVFAVNTDGSDFSILHNFEGTPDGAHSLGGLALAGDTLYGVTGNGGSYSYGSLFSLSTNGDAFAYDVLYNFNPASNGVLPNATLTFSNGIFYGVASGDGYGNPGWGTIFSCDTNGNYTPLYNFTAPHGSPLTNVDGEQPQGAVVLSGSALYGTAYGGGSNGYGTVFTLQTNGSNFAVLHSFSNSPDGAYCQAGIALAGGVLYGVTEIGGTNSKGTLFAINTDGSGYRVLHYFQTNGVDGFDPFAAVTVVGPTIYGTTRSGGLGSHGTIFCMNTNGGGYSVLYNFNNTTDGSAPECSLVVDNNDLYGVTESGGGTIWGTVFKFFLPVLDLIGVNLSGTNLILDAQNGTAGVSYVVLASASLASPLAQWTPVATNIPAASGNFTITLTNAVSRATPQQFYMLQAQ